MSFTTAQVRNLREMFTERLQEVEPTRGPTPREVLQEKLSSGKITQDEFDHMMRVQERVCTTIYSSRSMHAHARTNDRMQARAHARTHAHTHMRCFIHIVNWSDYTVDIDNDMAGSVRSDVLWIRSILQTACVYISQYTG